MTRAEEAASMAYPVKVEWVGNQYGGPEDINKLSRKKYQEGYSQAEKDLALTWQDMERIVELYKEVYVECDFFSRCTMYNEVLRRFNECKEGKK